MKSPRIVLTLIVIAICTQLSWSQAKYKHVTADYADGEGFTYFLKHRITMPGVWGLGGNAQYMLKHLIYAEVDAGYGWVIGDHSTEPDSFKKFRGWVEVKAGYPILNFTGKKTGKWVASQSSSNDYYYNIDVPAYFSLIALAGFTSEPTTTYQAPVFTVGLKWISYLDASVKVREKTGFVQRKFELYVGITIPAKNEILHPDNTIIASKSENLKFSPEFFISIPYRLNGWATFDIGVKSLGYNDESRFYIGNTFYL